MHSAVQDAFNNLSIISLERPKVYPIPKSEREFFGGNSDLEVGEWVSPSLSTPPHPYPNSMSLEVGKSELKTGH